VFFTKDASIQGLGGGLELWRGSFQQALTLPYWWLPLVSIFDSEDIDLFCFTFGRDFGCHSVTLFGLGLFFLQVRQPTKVRSLPICIWKTSQSQDLPPWADVLPRAVHTGTLSPCLHLASHRWPQENGLIPLTRSHVLSSRRANTHWWLFHSGTLSPSL
jgi:hypothetical protein